MGAAFDVMCQCGLLKYHGPNRCGVAKNQKEENYSTAKRIKIKIQERTGRYWSLFLS
jgi:hypothetical protein